MDIYVSTATEEDLAAVVRIDRDSFPVPWTLEVYREELARPMSNVLVARQKAADPSEAVAFSCSWQIHDEIQLLKLATCPTQRGRGFASALLQRLVTDADQRGVKSVQLELRKTNASALRIYHRFGFSEVGVRRGYYENGDDACLMTRVITQASQR